MDDKVIDEKAFRITEYIRKLEEENKRLKERLDRMKYFVMLAYFEGYDVGYERKNPDAAWICSQAKKNKDGVVDE